MIEQPTFVDQAFKTSANLLGSAAEVFTNPASKLYSKMSETGGSVDTLKRHVFKMFGLRTPKMRGHYGRPLQYS